MNTRRFPRSTLEAWPDRHPYSVSGPHKRTEGVIQDILGIVVVLLLVATTVHVLIDWAAAP